MSKKTKKEIRERQEFEMNRKALEAYLQVAWEDVADIDLIQKFMNHKQVIAMIPLSNERLKDLAAKIYVYYQLIASEVIVSFEIRNGCPVARVKKIKTPF